MNIILSEQELKEIKTLRPVAASVPLQIMKTYAWESQKYDVEPYLSTELMIAIEQYVENEDERPYDDRVKQALDTILFGGEYCNRLNFKRRCDGIIRALQYFTFARLIQNNQITVSQYGVEQKKNDVSVSASRQEIKRMQRDALLIAKSLLLETIEFVKVSLYASCLRKARPITNYSVFLLGEIGQ